MNGWYRGEGKLPYLGTGCFDSATTGLCPKQLQCMRAGLMRIVLFWRGGGARIPTCSPYDAEGLEGGE